MTNPLATSKYDKDTVGGSDQVLLELRQFRKLVALGISDAEIAHRMIKTKAEVRSMRRLFARGSESLKSLRIRYQVRLLLGKHGISTIGQLYAKSEEELLAIPGLGQRTLQHLREATYGDLTK